MRRFLVLFSLLLIPALTWNAAAKSFQDVPESHPNATAIKYLSSFRDVFRGEANTNRFNVNGLINRAEFAVILTRHLAVDLSDPSLNYCFPDVGESWFSAAVCYSKNEGWIKGYQSGPEAGKFMPTNNLNTAEVLVILDRVLGWESNPGQNWFDGSLSFADSSNILSGVPFDRALTRGQVAEVLFRSIVKDHYMVEKYDPVLGSAMVGETSGENVDPDADNTNLRDIQSNGQELIIGQLLSQAQPAGFNIPQGSTNVTVLRFQVNVDQPATIRSLRVKRQGAGNLLDIEEARLVHNGKEISDRRFSSEDATVTFSSLNIGVSPSSSGSFELVVDFAEDSTPVTFHNFQIEPIDVMFSNIDYRLDGQMLKSSDFQIIGLPVSTVTIKNPRGKLKVPFINSDDEVISRFIIEAGDADIIVKRIRLRDDGTLSINNYRDFRITAGSSNLSAQATIDRNILDFSMAGHSIEAGEDRTFTVHATISDGRVEDNIRFYLNDDTDLYAEDAEYGVGARVTNLFTRGSAKCAGSETSTCPPEGLQRRCSKRERDAGVEECLDDDDSSNSDTTASDSGCSTSFSPVCGRLNGILRPFPNQCDAEQQEATEISAGACNLSICGDEEAVVCGRVFDGRVKKNFINRCHAEEFRAITITDGPCDLNDDMCVTIFEPVCGTVQVECLEGNCSPVRRTFSNSCVANRQGATDVEDGEC